jgi:hypothetical protein
MSTEAGPTLELVCVALDNVPVLSHLEMNVDEYCLAFIYRGGQEN